MTGMWKMCMRHLYKEENILWTNGHREKGCNKTCIRWEGKSKVERSEALILHFVHYMLLILYVPKSFRWKHQPLVKVESVTDIPPTLVKLKVHRKQKTDNRATQAVDTEKSNFALLSNLLGKVRTCWSAPPWCARQGHRVECWGQGWRRRWRSQEGWSPPWIPRSGRPGNDSWADVWEEIKML